MEPVNKQDIQDVLDEDAVKTPGSLWSKTAAVFAALSLVLVIILSTLVIKLYNKDVPRYSVFEWLLKAICVTVSLGFVATIASVVKKERLKYFRVAAMVINTVLFILIISLVCYGMYIRWRMSR